MLIKIHMEGAASKVQPFISNLQHRYQLEIINQDILTKNVEESGQMLIQCQIDGQSLQMPKIVQLITKDGGRINIPMLDMIQVEIEQGVMVWAGRVFDVFG